ncbi:hypothetical protein PG997_008887 [Apiospora hydei]|uniref:Uncharacterized protein n=1 Tax=Apiospora hydei TaxID=1337664 RepID=A0ABR1WC28_9PEZI
MSVLRPSNRTPTFPFRLKLLLFLVLLLGVFIHRYTRQAPSDQPEITPKMERDDVSDTFSTTVSGDTIFTPPTSVLSSGCDHSCPSTVDCDTIPTPSTSVLSSGCDHSCPPTIVGDEVWDGCCFPAVPWPGNTYLIIEQASGRPIVRNRDGGIALGNPSEASTSPAHSRWLCVEANNHFGFQNPQSGRYFGHDGGDIPRATAWGLNEWEYIMWRPHPKGGFQLLSLFWMHSLKLYIVSEDGNALVRRMHGTTLFEFKKL